MGTVATATITDYFGPRFATISLDRHRGKGAAVRTAMQNASGRVVGFIDADLPFELAALRDGYLQIRSGQCQVVFGARDLGESARLVRRRPSRILATSVFRGLTRRLISREVTDTQCGLKLFRHDVARQIYSRTTLDGFASDAEVVLWTERLKLRYRRMPVSLVREYGSTLSLWRDTMPMLLDIVRLWWRHRAVRDIPPSCPSPLTVPDVAERRPAA
mgnify:CR=1 FL=1